MRLPYVKHMTTTTMMMMIQINKREKQVENKSVRSISLFGTFN